MMSALYNCFIREVLCVMLGLYLIKTGSCTCQSHIDPEWKQTLPWHWVNQADRGVTFVAGVNIPCRCICDTLPPRRAGKTNSCYSGNSLRCHDATSNTSELSRAPQTLGYLHQSDVYQSYKQKTYRSNEVYDIRKANYIFYTYEAMLCVL